MDEILTQMIQTQGLTGLLLGYIIFSFERYNRQVGERIERIGSTVNDIYRTCQDKCDSTKN